IIIANVPPNDPNVDASAIVPAHVNPDHAPAQPVGHGNGFAPNWIGDNIPNNQKGWIEEDAKEEIRGIYVSNAAKRQKSKDSFPLPLGSQDRKPPAEPSARPIPAPYPDDPYLDTRDAANAAAAAVATSGIDDDDDDTAPMDSHPYEPHFIKCSPITFRGNEGAVGLIRSIEKTTMVFTMIKCTDANKVVFTATTFQDWALTWWNSQVSTLGIEAVTRKTWAEMKEMDISLYTTRFNKLMILCPGMVPTKRKNVEAYISGLSENIKGEVTSFKLATLNKAVQTAHTLMEQKVKVITEREADNKKRKWENFQGGSSGGGNSNNNRNNKNYPSNHNNNNNNRNNNQNQYRNPNPNPNHKNNQRQGNVRGMTNVGNQNTNEAGQNMKCNKCGIQHYENCLIKCNKCGKIRHKARDCWSKVVATGENAQPIVTCYGCGEKGHIKANCPTRNNQRSRARGQAYALRDGDQNLGPNVVTGTFLLNNRYARVLFDSGSDKIFMNVNFSHLIDIEPIKVDHSYEVKLADGRVVSTNTILSGYALNLVYHLFVINLMPIELGTFYVIIRMDWLILHDAVIVCGKKEVHVPLKKRKLVVKGNDCVSRLKVVSCLKVKKYVDRRSYLFVAQVIEKEPAERRLADVPVICEFPDMFPKDLPGLPPPQQVEFEIELVPGATNKEEHEEHLRMILELLQKEKLYAKFSKCEFWSDSMKFLGHMINSQGVYIDPTKIEAIKSWTAPKSSIEGEEEEEAFQLLNDKLCSASILALPEGSEDFVVYCDASLKGYGAVLM
nr:hypothetical protein [Tanacetum cinerariifolium]